MANDFIINFKANDKGVLKLFKEISAEQKKVENSSKNLSNQMVATSNAVASSSSSTKKATKASEKNIEVLNQNRIEAQKLSKAMRFYGISVEDTQLAQTTFEKALTGSSIDF